jgi:hypothetical protein
MMTWRSLAGLLMAAVMSWPIIMAAQTPAQDATQSATGNATAESPLPLDQIVTKTVHEAWVASGRNEDRFFAMVQQLAELSAQHRGVTLPDSQAAGSKFGGWIKQEARKDPDQLLYTVVDHAVRHIGKTQASAAGASTAPAK